MYSIHIYALAMQDELEPDTTYNPYACLADDADNYSCKSSGYILPDLSKQDKTTMTRISAPAPSKLVAWSADRRHTVSYIERIEMIEHYFGVSNICAVYLYYRRRRGTPWKATYDLKYLEWCIQLQNAIILLDTIVGFDWMSLEFGFEEIQFIKNNIIVSTMSTKPAIIERTCPATTLSSDINGDGFTKVSYLKIDITKELNKMGLLPRRYIAGKRSSAN